jgi:hypothetical protein
MAMARGEGGFRDPYLLGKLLLLFLQLRGLRCSQELKLRSIIRLTDRAFQPEPVIPRDTATVAVIAEDISSVVTILLRHRLFFNVPIKSSELTFHVCNTLGADRALVARVAPISKARFMYAVSATHECDGFVRGEHKFTTDGAVRFRTPLNTLVGALSRDRHASGTSLAVEEVFAQAFPESTDAAVVTVIH